MRHVLLTCRNHPNLRWGCKEVAFSDEHGYNGSRSIFFWGEPNGKGLFEDKSGIHCSTYFAGDPPRIVEECKCSSRDLIRAPEDKDIGR